MLTLTQSMADRLVGAFEAGADWALGAKILSIPRSTLMAAVKRDEDLAARVEDARAAADEVVIKSLYTMATVDKNVTAAIFWLKNRRPQDWRDRKELMFGVTAEQASHMTVDELDAKLLRMGVAPEALQ